jgi:FkbM family methyltransferase
MNRGKTWRGLAKSTRNQVLWRTPCLQALIRAATRRGCVPSWAWGRLHPRGVWTLHAPDGTAFLYDSTFEHDGLARHIVWTDMRDWEASTQPVLFDLAKAADVFVDVGAYSGIYTVLACVANPSLRVVAFEPNVVKIQQITANVTANGLKDRVTIIEKALAAKSGVATLSIPPDDSTASLNGAGPDDRVTNVVVTTGDLALASLPVGLVKIDVEGLEAEVLAGMSRTLSTHRPKIIAECLDSQALQGLQNSTRELGYQHAYHIDHGGLVPVGGRPFRPANYLFTAEPMNGRMMAIY